MITKLCMISFFIMSLGVYSKGLLDKTVREQCENMDVCKWDIAKNCVYRCMSEDCYTKLFSDNPLEPGEISFDLENSFYTCFWQEKKEIVSRNNHNSYT
ncbi:hypothetical protein SteCoe_18664 [Stentor coeruleus]|uniref:Apple domain-containing protein n=1 Tax=Stentor coeruleus TaxID=5963 RepID=A0A1R2BWD1_9CILI|nr:hypothetical protein SteCoe_18664 [Stentor coeruleus]